MECLGEMSVFEEEGFEEGFEDMVVYTRNTTQDHILITESKYRLQNHRFNQVLGLSFNPQPAPRRPRHLRSSSRTSPSP
jgi:hypothetical protein